MCSSDLIFIKTIDKFQEEVKSKLAVHSKRDDINMLVLEFKLESIPVPVPGQGSGTTTKKRRRRSWTAYS